MHRAGHEVVLVSLTEEVVKDFDYQEVKRYCSQVFLFPISPFSIFYHAAINILRGVKWPFQVAYFYDFKVQRALEHIVKTEKPDHIHCHLARMSPYLDNIDVSKSLDFMDAFGAGTRRRADISPFFIRPFWRLEARWMQHFEHQIVQKYAFSTVISKQDKLRLSATETKIHIVPNGVDVDFFDKNNYNNLNSVVEKKYDLCFVGNLGYYSNVEAVRFLVKKIVPLVKAQKPNIKILLAGARPTAEIQRFADSNITVVGWLDDIRQAYAESRILVAPLMHGIGQQNKILEAMAMQVPVVTTTRVNNAIGSESEKDILLADTEGVFAEQILKLLQNVDLQNLIDENALDFVHKNYAWQSSTQVFMDLLEQKIIVKQPN